MSAQINRTVLMSGPQYFAVKELNPYSKQDNQPDATKAAAEFASIKAAVEQAGVKVVQVDAPKGCQDGIFTANWGLCRGDTCILSSLPEARKAEEPYAAQVLQQLGKRVIRPRAGEACPSFRGGRRSGSPHALRA